MTDPPVPGPVVPPDFIEHMAGLGEEGGPSGASWVRALPRLLDSYLDAWGLTPDGPALTGHTALVLPVRRDGEALALKLGWPHPDAEHEHLVLRRWAGCGAVTLLAARPADHALLLERLDAARDLTTVWDEDACVTIGRILADLHVPALPQLRPLSGLVRTHLGRLAATPGVLPPRLVERVRGLAAELLSDPSCDGTTVHTDLHYENVLARPSGGPDAWAAIDPKPLAGHPGWEVAPVLWNRSEELGTGPAFRWSVRRRLEVVCDAAGIDEDEARAWTIVREAVEALWAHEDGDHDRVSLSVSLTKALDD